MTRDHFKRSNPWLKRVLIPFWVIQLILILFIFIIFVLSIIGDPSSFAVYQVLLLVLCLASIILDVTEIILFARRRLKPLLYLIFQIVKTTIWFALFVNALARGIIVHVDTNLTYGVIIYGVLFFAFLATLIYGSVIYHRHQRNKRNASNITQNPYYSGPYGEHGIPKRDYQPVDSTLNSFQPAGTAVANHQPSGTALPTYPPVYPPHSSTAIGPGTPLYSGEGIVSPFGPEVARNSILAGGGHAPAHVVGELEEPDRKGMARDRTMELSSTSEVYELATRKADENRHELQVI